MIADVAIAGGGPAGTAAAIVLARAGRDVILVERHAAAVDKVCGEFVSAEAETCLARLGLDLAALGGRPIETVRLVRGTGVVESRLPFRGIGLSRRVLDEALLKLAAASGVVLRRGVGVAAVAGGAVPALRLAGGKMLPAGAVFIATGKHDLRGMRRPPANMMGVKTYVALAPAQSRALDGAVELVLFPGGHAGIQAVEGGRAVLCATLDPALVRRAGWPWADFLLRFLRTSPHLGCRLDGAVPLLDRPLAIGGVPYGFIYDARPDDPNALFRVGDQAAVIPSFAGDGIAIALYSGILAARAVLAGNGSDSYHARLRRTIRGQIGRTVALYRIGRTSAGQAALLRVASSWPGVLGLAAHLTRLPDCAVGCNNDST